MAEKGEDYVPKNIMVTGGAGMYCTVALTTRLGWMRCWQHFSCYARVVPVIFH